MEQKHMSCGSVCDRLPNMSAKYPWLVAQNLEGNTNDQIFYTMHDPLSPPYRELLGRRIRGCFHGWVILSSYPNNIMWSLWNPVTCKTIRLPPLVLKDGDFESIRQCCLSSPPNDPTSVLMLTRTKTPTIVFCQVYGKRKRLRWKEMTYAKQLTSITGDNTGFLHCLTCYNGKVYALNSGGRNCIAIQVDIVVKVKEVVISLLAFGKLPFSFNDGYFALKPFLRGNLKDLFFIKVGFYEIAKKTPADVYLFKLDMTSMIWEEMEDLKDAIFFIDLSHDCSVFYRDAIASELGGYIHILGEMGKVIYSYDIKDKTVSLSSMSCMEEQSTHLSLWECRLNSDQGEIECGTGFKPTDEIMVRPVMDDEVDINDTKKEKPYLLNIPLDVLRIIMDFCVGIEYLNFRATCKHCQLAAPMVRWNSETSQRRLQTYSLNSPWLIVLDKHQGIITFTDPMSGYKYFTKMPQKLIGDLRICYSGDGWLLLYKLDGSGELFFFNPFTKDIRELPNAPYFDSVYVLAPPTSPHCMVVGLTTSLPLKMFFHILTWGPFWARFPIDFRGSTPHSFPFLTIVYKQILALNQGALNIFRHPEGSITYVNSVVAEYPIGSSSLYFLAECNEHLLLVVMDELGEFVEVLKLKGSPVVEWEKIDNLGSHMIYICGSTCLCMEAKTPEMENKIYFPRLGSEDGKIIFYSLETRQYHTFNDRNIQQCSEDFVGTKYHVHPHAWIQPSWSYLT